MTQSAATVRSDFDRIAELSGSQWGHNDYYLGDLLKHVPPDGGDALDIGCGAGRLSLALARHCRRVTGLDLSPQMIRVARKRALGIENVRFEVADVMTWDSPADRFDCIASVATVHHVPIEPFIERVQRWLRPGGVLLVLDLFQCDGLLDRSLDVVRLPVSAALRLLHTGHLRQPAELRRAWAEHGRTERYPTMREVRAVAARHLPGAIVRRHLLWRYSLVWRKLM